MSRGAVSSHGSHRGKDHARASPCLRIVTYNVRYFGHATRGIASTSSAVTKIARSLVALDPTPDLICLQEVETRSLRSNTMNRKRHPEETQLGRLMVEIDEALAAAGKDDKYNAYYFPAHSYKLTTETNIYTTGLAVIAHDSFTIAHHNAGRPHDITHRRLVKNLKQTRICAHVSFTYAGGLTFDIFNTHLSLPNVLTKQFWTQSARMGFGPNQLSEAKTLADFVEQERRGEDFVVVGDFNAIPGSLVDRYLREERGFVDAFSKARGLSEAERRAWPTAGFMNLRMHIDHVYSGPRIEWLDFNDTLPFGAEGPFAGLSDHTPLIGRFQLPPIAGC